MDQMSPNQLDSPMKKPQDSLVTQPQRQLTRQNLIQYLLFYSLFILIDLALLIQYSNHLLYIAPKIGLNFLILLIILIMQHKLNELSINFVILFTKVISILFVILIGHEYILILAYIFEHNQMNLEQLHNFIPRIIIKISSLVLMIIYFNNLDIIIVSCIFILEGYKFVLIMKEQKLKQPSFQFCSQQNKTQRETLTACSKENSWINKISLLPLCYIVISRKDFQITYKNQNVYQQFSQICKSEEEFNELFLNKMTFSIIQENSEDQKNIVTDQHIKKNRIKAKNMSSYSQAKHELSQESIRQQNYDKITLMQILECYKDGRLWDIINPVNNTLELFCQYYWNISQEFQAMNQKFSTYSGQILINNEEDEIILTLIDISRQNRFQEERIKDQFKTSIVQSFSHELRTPLNSSCNFLQFCLNDRSINDDIKNNFITPALNALRLQSYLINDIIDFSSLCSDNIELDITNVTVEQIVDEVNKLFKSVLEMKNLILYVDLTENQLKSVGTDFSRLIQIIANILQNSIKFSNQGIILLKLTSFSQNYLKITIKDEGFGIEDERLEQIQQMLLDVEERKNFSDYKTWHGFGLLISSMLLSKLRPESYKSLLIRSGGHLKGTKVTFYIQNQKLSHQSSSVRVKENPKRINSRLRASQTGSNHVSINGTLIQISDLFVSNRRVKINTQLINKQTMKSVISGEMSGYSDSVINMDCDNHIGDINHLQPFLFTDNAYQPSRFSKQESPRSYQQQMKIVSYKQLKMQEDQESEQQLQQIFKKRRCTCKRLLSVDDEIFNQKSIQFLLSQYGFEVILAFNGEEAIKIVKEIPKCSSNCCLFLLILMDYQMPIMDGLKTTQALRQMMDSHIIPPINVIGLTAFNSKNDIEQCFNAGMGAVLTKPLIIAEFFDILKCF